MPTFDSNISDFVVGDDLSIRRTIGFSASGFDSGVTVASAWLTIKSDPADADPGLIQKVISTTDVPGTGQIENDGTGDTDIVVRFDLTPTNTLAIGTSQRYFDIQIKTTSGKVYTPETGRISALPEITTSS